MVGEGGWHRASPGLDEINWGWRTLTRWRTRSRCLSHSSLQPTASSLAARSPGGLSVTHFISKWLILLSFPSERWSNKADFRRAICESDTWFQAARTNLPHEINTTTAWSNCCLFSLAFAKGDNILELWKVPSVVSVNVFRWKKSRFIFINLAVVSFALNVRGQSTPNSQQGAMLLRILNSLLSLKIMSNKYPR